MTEYKSDIRANVSIKRRRKPYYYRPSHSPPKSHGGQALHGKQAAILVLSLVLIAAVLIGVVLVGFFTSYFDVKSIEISGLSENSREEVIAFSGIEVGKKLYSINAKEAEQKILDAFPKISGVEIKKQLPDSVSISLTYDVPKYFIKVTGEYFTLSEGLRVLTRGGSKKELEAEGLIYLELPNISRAVTGEELGFFSGAEAFIKPFLDDFSSSELSAEIDRIYIKNKFDISLVSVGKYRIEMGDVKDQVLKMKMAEKMLDVGGYRDLEGVVLNVSDVTESSAIVSKTLKIE